MFETARFMYEWQFYADWLVWSAATLSALYVVLYVVWQKVRHN